MINDQHPFPLQEDPFADYMASVKPGMNPYIRSLRDSGTVCSVRMLDRNTAGITVAFKKNMPLANIVDQVVADRAGNIQHCDRTVRVSSGSVKSLIAFGTVIADNTTLDVLDATVHSCVRADTLMISYPQKLLRGDGINLRDVLTGEKFMFVNAHVTHSRVWSAALTDRENCGKYIYGFRSDALSTPFHIAQILRSYDLDGMRTAINRIKP